MLAFFFIRCYGLPTPKTLLIIENGKILPTPLGKAAFASSIAPEES